MDLLPDNKDRLIKAQKELIIMFDQWVQLVKAQKLPEASELVKQSNIKRLEVANIEKTLKSKIIIPN
jgi:hypothetical protein